jgi:hypothetical protein
MRLPRLQVRWLSGWLIVALLFMQFATAAHACPALPVVPHCHDEAASVDTPDADPAALCKAHCELGSQTVVQAPAFDAAPSQWLLAVLDWALAASIPADGPARRPGLASGAPPPGAPPLYLSLLVLRN